MTYISLSPDERARAALPVLIAARRAVAFEGAEPIDAIQTAGNAKIECWYARLLLSSVVPSVNLIAWQTDPCIRRSDKTRAFDRAIRIARAAYGHRGGWVVSGAEAMS